MKVHTAFRALTLILIGTIATRAMAYEEDMHFQLTYVLCRAAGLTAPEALKVAAVDQGMDDSIYVTATSFKDGILYNEEAEWKWHALDLGGRMEAKGIVARKDELFKIALTRGTDADKLFCLGVFFHYQQDTWSHRHHYDGGEHSYDRYTTYNTPHGHFIDGHLPDRLPYDPVAALMCLEDGLKYLNRFVVEGLHRQPRPFLRDYVSKGGSVLANWQISKAGEYFNTLTEDGGYLTPRRFLIDLVRVPVFYYPATKDIWGNSVPDEIGYDDCRRVLQNLCNNFRPEIGEDIVIPPKQTKINEGYFVLKTAEIEKRMK